jgi:hypothetical protein
LFVASQAQLETAGVDSPVIREWIPRNISL